MFNKVSLEIGLIKMCFQTVASNYNVQTCTLFNFAFQTLIVFNIGLVHH